MKKYGITKQDALLLVIDAQERLCSAMDQALLGRMLHQTGLLCLYAKKEGLPVILTEQYSKGLGKTIPSLQKHLDGIPYDYFDKVSFGCAGDGPFMKTLTEKYPDKKIIITGMETHVCVYLTALGLIEKGFSVLVAQDAVISRGREYHQNGLQLMDRLGAVITNTESLVFQLMQCAGGDTFKAVSGYIKENGLKA
ncbi:MAG TPA: isochorismatase family protein [bacterium]|nr:isochorismatase family protein [bacterium]